MTTQEFIARTFNTTSDRERHCSSVFTDHNGTVYSYGYHYPLAFNVDGLNFINARGYSSSTGRHISWAKRAIGNYIEVWLPRPEYGQRGEYTLDDVMRALQAERLDIERRMSECKRKNTKKYARLVAEHEDVQARILRVGQAR
jgi:hypothetical protein